MTATLSVMNKNTLTPRELTQAILDQALDLQKESNKELNLTFENVNFSEPYLDEEQLYNPLYFIRRILATRGLDTFFESFNIRFIGCSIYEVSYEPQGGKPISLYFLKCKIGFMRSYIIHGGAVIIDDSTINNLRFHDNKVDGTFFCSKVQFNKFDARGMRFEKPVTFKECNFGEGAGNNQFVNFSNSKFSQAVTFEGSIFTQAPSFFDAELHTDTEFRNCEFLDVHSPFAWRAYRTLKQFMMSKESDHEAQKFHSLELEARYNTELPKGITKIISASNGMETICSFVLKQINDYGRNLWLPFVWLCLFSDIFLILYALNGGVGCSITPNFGWLSDACDGKATLIYTLRNFLGPFGIILNNDAIIPNTLTVKILGLFHVLISSLILFVWVLQVRSRFKI